jgi:transposase InsO family protein
VDSVPADLSYSLHLLIGLGFAYVAFVIDTFANRIVGWKVSRSAKTDFSMQT